MGKEKDWGIDNIYVVHALKGYEFHEKRVRDILQTLNFEFEFATEGDPSLWTDELIDRYFVPNIKDLMTEGGISCTLNHILVYEQMLKRGNRLALVFEDDLFLLNHFEKNLPLIINETKTLKPGFIVSLENSTLRFPSRKVIRKNKLLYPAKLGRCTGAYIIDREGATKCLEDLKTNPCNQIVDWWHNYLIDRHVIKSYWVHPPVIEQGSHNGKTGSNLSFTPKSMGRRMKWTAQKYYKMYILQFFK
jgi:glycosyl transferase family 25